MDEDKLKLTSKGLGIKDNKNLLIAFLIWAIFQFLLPVSAPITKGGMGVVGVFLVMLWLWVTEGSGWPSLLCVGMMGLTGVCKASDLFAKTWGNVMVPFLVACFLLNGIMAETGLTRRIALWFITRPSCKGRPWRILFMFFLSIMIIGLVSTSSPIIILYMALAEEIFVMTGYKKGDDLVKAVMISIFYVGQGTQFITPISHALVQMVFTYIENDSGIIITYGNYMLVMLPAGILLFIAFWFIFKHFMKPNVEKLGNLDIDALRASVPKMTYEEIIVAVVYGIVIIIWAFPDLFVSIGMVGFGKYLKSLGTAVPALIGAAVLSAIRIKSKPMVNLGKLNKNVAWNSVYMMSAVMGTAYLFGLDTCGVTIWLRNSLKPLLGNMPAMLFVICITTFIVIMTNFMSNTLTASMYTVITPIALTIAGVNPIALALLIAGGCNISLAMPSSCPAGGLASGAGWTPVAYQIKYGWMIAGVSIILLSFISYFIGCALYPY